MKKILTFIILALGINGASAQPWFDIGIKGGIGTSFMYNKQIFDEQQITHKFKLGNTYGAKLGFNFVQEHQITFDIMQTSYTQGFTYTNAGTEANRQYNIKGLDLLLMYRTNRKGTYFEIGPQWSTISSVKYTDDGGYFLTPYTFEQVINKKNFGIALGFGGYAFGTDNFGVTTGLRVNYILSDLINDRGKQVNFPILQPNEGSDPTHNLGIMFIVEMNYDFGYLVSSRCGKRTKLFVF